MKFIKGKYFICLCFILFILTGCQSDTDEKNVLRPIFQNNYCFNQVKSVDDVYAIYTEFYFDYYPTMRDFLGDISSLGYDNPKKYFNEISKEAEMISKEVNLRAIEALKKFDVEPYSQDYYNKKILIWMCQSELEKIQYSDQHFLLHPFFGPQKSIYRTLASRHEIHSLADAQSFIERIEDSSRYIDDLMKRIEESAEAGYMIQRQTAFELGLDLSDDLKSFDEIKNKFYHSLDQLELSDDEKSTLINDFDVAFESFLISSYKDLIKLNSEIRTQTPFGGGLSEYPDGKAYYQNYIIPKNVSYPITAEEIHQIGLNEVERISEELEKLAHQMGYATTLDAIHQLENIPSYITLEEYKEILIEMHEKLPSLFHQEFIPNEIPEIVQSQSNTYTRGSIDGKRKGLINYSGYIDNYRAKALIIHEGSPGHHLQLSYATEKLDNHVLRKLFGTTCYIEGWALYAEKIAFESGWIETDEEKMGMLLSELFRAARLVVDTGLHYYDWTPAQAEDYLSSTAYFFYPEFEVLRYMYWPGQALSYKMGEIKILELRQLTEEALGDDFCVKDFHRLILEDGSLPLSLLEEKVLHFIKNHK